MEGMSFDEIQKRVEEYFKNLGYEVQFNPDKDDYQNVLVFRVINKKKRVVLPEQQRPISQILDGTNLENYLSQLKTRLKSGEANDSGYTKR